MCYLPNEFQLQKFDIFSLQANKGENKSPPRNCFDIDFRMALNQFEYSISKCIFVPSFILSPCHSKSS